jgi:hypothetical protein
MNLKYADAFAHEVGAVHLYILDSNNDVVWEGEDSGDALAQEGYEMEVDVQPGKYSLLAWCTTNHKNSFEFADDGTTTTTTTTPTNSKVKELSFKGTACSLKSDGEPTPMMTEEEEGFDPAIIINHELDDLYHGLLQNVTFSSESGTHVITVPLTKDTNRVRVVLQHMSGEPISADQFTFSITDDNAVLRNDNSIVPENKVLYRPWYQTSVSTNSEISNGGTTKADGDSEGTDDVISVAAAELTVNRLVVDNAPRLTVVNNETGSTVFSIPVKDYALMVKGYEKADMDDQEYLDRQDEYNMTFFLDEKDRWVSSYIYINSWKVVLQNSGL